MVTVDFTGDFVGSLAAFNAGLLGEVHLPTWFDTGGVVPEPFAGASVEAFPGVIGWRFVRRNRRVYPIQMV